MKEYVIENPLVLLSAFVSCHLAAVSVLDVLELVHDIDSDVFF